MMPFDVSWLSPNLFRIDPLVNIPILNNKYRIFSMSLNEVLSKTEIPIIASGGVTTIDDIEKLILLTKKGLSGVIIGKAIYESRIKIKDLIMLESRI